MIDPAWTNTMNRQFVLAAQGKPPVLLRAIGPEDQEDLRSWKNSNRVAFFFKEEITPEGQRRWFEGFRNRQDDHMFVVESEGFRAGCMGFRILDGGADCYNVIGLPAAAGRGILKAAMQLMCSYIRDVYACPIGCKVLKDNPAVGWYQKCGYRIAQQEPDHYRMELDLSRFVPRPYVKRSPAWR
ncbi:MAG: GNAT family N-acetyltransferase [Acidobacteria bacterium]|nr:GNAT family N-acetyltransferase [Acidobacteriota bacterium]